MSKKGVGVRSVPLELGFSKLAWLRELEPKRYKKAARYIATALSRVSR